MHMNFIDLMIVYVKISSEVLWPVMAKKDMPREYINVVQNMYKERTYINNF